MSNVPTARRVCEWTTFCLLELVNLTIIIITAAGLQLSDKKEAEWSTLQQAYVEGSTLRDTSMCLLGVVNGFNTCNYMYAVGALGTLMAAMCFMHHERYFKPEVVLGLKSAKAYLAAFGILWYLGAGVCVGVLNDPLFQQPAACIACDNIRPRLRYSVWVVCFAGSGICLMLLFWFGVEVFLGPSAPPALAPVQGRLFTYGTRSTSYRSHSHSQSQDGQAAAIALHQAQAIAAARAAKAKMLRLGAFLSGSSHSRSDSEEATIPAGRDPGTGRP